MMTAIQAIILLMGISGAPPLLVLNGTIGDSVSHALEEEFCTELALWVDSYTLHVQPSFSFNSDSQLDRIEQLRPLVEATGAEVVIWIERTAQHQYALQLLSFAMGRSVSRTTIVSPSPLAASELAVAARELLHEIYPSTVSLTSRAQSPATGAVPEEAEPASTSRPFIGAIALGAQTAIGIVGDSGPSVNAGGDLVFLLQWSAGMNVSLSFGGFAVPAFFDEEPPSLKSGGFRIGAGASWLKTVKFFSLGPALSLEALYERTQIAFPDADPVERGWWRLRITPALDTRFKIASRLSAGFQTGLGIAVRQMVFETESGNVVYATPFLDWQFRLLLIAGVF